MQPLFPNDNHQTQQGTHQSADSLNNPNLWKLLKSKMKSLMTPDQYDQWVTPITAVKETEQELELSMPNEIFYHGFVDTHLETLSKAKTLIGKDHLIVRLVPETAVTRTEAEHNGLNPDHEQPNGGQSFSKALSPPSQLNQQYTFNTFVRGVSNQFAHATCMAVADAPGKTYNPLFIYGSTGLGKTHLLQAVGNKVLKDNPKAVVCYISSERFMNEMIHCIRHGKMPQFRQKYRNCDVFLVDDIQFISKKERTQEEFFHTFNALYEAKKQIIITSDKFPQDISDIEERLRNRFQWGLIADIQPPDIEHRIAILMTKAEQLNISLSQDVAMYIGTHAKKNVRELEGALHRITAFAGLKGRPIDMELAAETFKNVLTDAPKRVTIEAIQKIVAEHFRVKVSDLKSKKRQRAISLPRQIAMYLARTKTNSSFPEIGDKFGGKDHTTVMHAVRKIDGELPKDIDLRSHVDALKRRLEQMN